MCPAHDPKNTFNTTALVLPKLTSRLPSKEVINFDPLLFSGLSLAEPKLLRPDSVDVILGADIYGQILQPGLKRLSPSKLVAQDTVLGWIITGPIPVNPSPCTTTVSRTQCLNTQRMPDENLQTWLQKFWEIEELPPHHSLSNPEDETCEQLFQNTQSRDPDGKYVVYLPLKSQIPNSSSETPI